MNIKLPTAYDVSHWKEIPDFKAIAPRPALMITKATEAHPGSAYNHTDDKFQRFMAGMMEIGCTRGAYHFFRKALDARKQAEHFLNVISQTDILSTDLLVLDVEEGGEKASQLWVWFETVRKAYPANLLMLYSRANILNPIAMTESEKAYFKRIPIWTAGYPWFPDLYSVCPAGYVPDQSKYGPVWLWQYSEKGQVAGIIGAVDCNWINPALYSVIGERQQIGEAMLINATGRCTDANNKVWDVIGGRVIGSFRLGQTVIIDQEQTAAGVRYVHASGGNVSGWTKAQWYAITANPTPEPDPEPEPEPQPTPAKTPFTLNVTGYKPFTGELEKIA